MLPRRAVLALALVPFCTSVTGCARSQSAAGAVRIGMVTDVGGLGDRGVIRVGARCDLAVLNSSQWVDVAYHLGGDVVSRVILAGRVVHGR